ncbi:MAG: hypothetical protein E6J23_06550 [Chloroflexi bacterium]|nr:MAG: hypothetical protein E6J23_06550 [Chloroflexota bacterium]
MKGLRILMSAIFVMAALIGSSQQASAHGVQLVATINGAGRAVMDEASPLKGTTTYFIHARLYSDGTAIGRFDCVDLAGSTAEGDFFGPITSWKMVNGEIRLSGAGQLRTLSGDLVPGIGTTALPYTVAIQTFGGKGVGHWTLEVPAFAPVAICSERLTSGRLVMATAGRRNEDDSD